MMPPQQGSPPEVMAKLEGSTFTPVEMPKNPEVKFAKPVEEFAAFGNAPPPAPAANRQVS